MTTSQLIFLLPLAGLVLSMLFMHRGGHGTRGCGGGHAHGDDRKDGKHTHRHGAEAPVLPERDRDIGAQR